MLSVEDVINFFYQNLHLKGLAADYWFLRNTVSLPSVPTKRPININFLFWSYFLLVCIINLIFVEKALTYFLRNLLTLSV